MGPVKFLVQWKEPERPNEEPTVVSVGLDHYVKHLNKRGYVYAEHWFPHDVLSREMSTGMSRVDTLEGLGITPTIVKVGDVLDGINAVRRMLDTCWIDPDRCAHGLEALKQYHRSWNDKLKTWEPKPRHDWSSHSADALRTFAMGFEAPRRKPPGKTSSRWFSRNKQSTTSWLRA
jgi:phage terminase large subunit